MLMEPELAVARRVAGVAGDEGSASSGMMSMAMEPDMVEMSRRSRRG